MEKPNINVYYFSKEVDYKQNSKQFWYPKCTRNARTKSVYTRHLQNTQSDRNKDHFRVAGSSYWSNRLGRERRSAGRPENSGVYGYERVMFGIAPTNFSIAFIMRHIIEVFDSWRLDLPELFYLTKQTSLKVRQRYNVTTVEPLAKLF